MIAQDRSGSSRKQFIELLMDGVADFVFRNERRHPAREVVVQYQAVVVDVEQAGECCPEEPLFGVDGKIQVIARPVAGDVRNGDAGRVGAALQVVEQGIDFANGFFLADAVFALDMHGAMILAEEAGEGKRRVTGF